VYVIINKIIKISIFFAEELNMKKRLYKIETDKKLDGVCGGIAEYFDMDPTLVRLGWVIITLFSAGAGVIGYIAAAVIMPPKSDVEK
jgi:phage shock protein C